MLTLLQMYPCTYICMYLHTNNANIFTWWFDVAFCYQFSFPILVAPNKCKHTLSSNWESLNRRRKLRLNSHDHKSSVVNIDKCSSVCPCLIPGLGYTLRYKIKWAIFTTLTKKRVIGVASEIQLESAKAQEWATHVTKIIKAPKGHVKKEKCI